MAVSIETLDLSSEELEACREAVRQLAYCLWQDAGSPSGEGQQFWSAAERQWIERIYVPRRALDGTRPDSVSRSNQFDAHAQFAETDSHFERASR